MELLTYGRTRQVIIPLKVYKDLDYIPEVPPESTYQIIIIESGTGIMICNQKRSIIHAPTVYLLNEYEKATLEKADNLKLHIIYFTPQVIDIKFTFSYVRLAPRDDINSTQVQDLFWLNSFLDRQGGSENHYQLTRVMRNRLVYLLDNIFNEFDSQVHFWVCRGRSYFLEMLCYLSMLHTAKTPKIEVSLEPQSEIMENILLFIHSNYSERITLQHLVDRFNLNRTTLNDMFKKATGEAVITYIIKLRIEIAALMLRDTGVPVNEVGYRVGFEDSVNFGRMFKKHKSCTPKQYREENSWLLQ